MQSVDTDSVKPLAHPLDMTQRMRADKVTEQDRREQLQSLAPQSESGLYLVPKVIEYFHISHDALATLYSRTHLELILDDRKNSS